MGTDLQAQLACTCGRLVVARAKDAGGSVTCACGKQVTVPRLSELRTLSGADAYITNPAEAIRKLQAQGINPAGDRCLVCSAMSPDFYVCHAACEESYTKKESSTGDVSLPTLFVKILLRPQRLLASLTTSQNNMDTSAERRGHDVNVSFNLPVCGACTASAGGTIRPKKAKKLMTGVPALADLLAFYPNLKLEVEHPH